MKLVREISASVVAAGLRGAAGLRRSFHVAAPFPSDDNPQVMEDYFNNYHAPQLHHLYQSYPSPPKITISKVDYCLGYARCPKPYKDEFHKYLKQRLITVAESPYPFSPYPFWWFKIPAVSKLTRPIITLVPRAIERGWCHGYSDYSMEKDSTIGGVSAYYLYNYQLREHFTSSWQISNDVVEGEALALRDSMVRAHVEGITKLHSFSDSREVVNWVKGINDIPSDYAHLTGLIREIVSLSEQFEDFRLDFTFREGNTIADHIARRHRVDGEYLSSFQNYSQKLLELIDHLWQGKPYFVYRFK